MKKVTKILIGAGTLGALGTLSLFQSQAHKKRREDERDENYTTTLDETVWNGNPLRFRTVWWYSFPLPTRAQAGPSPSLRVEIDEDSRNNVYFTVDAEIVRRRGTNTIKMLAGASPGRFTLSYGNAKIEGEITDTGPWAGSAS